MSKQEEKLFDDMNEEEKAAYIEKEEDEYFEMLLKSFQNDPNKPTIEEDIEFFKNHPLNCKELTPEMMEKPEFKAL
jgi:hypothetical protein